MAYRNKSLEVSDLVGNDGISNPPPLAAAAPQPRPLPRVDEEDVRPASTTGESIYIPRADQGVDLKDPYDPRNPLFFWRINQLFTQMYQTIGTEQNYTTMTAQQFGQVADASLNALVQAGVITQSEAQQIRSFASERPEMFRAAFDSQVQDWRSSGVISETGFDSRRAMAIAGSDNAGEGYCARGTRNILIGMGFRSPTGNAEDWDQQLAQTGWVRLRGVNPHNAPEGALLFFDSDDGNGRAARNEGGGLYGHVEVVATDGNGGRLFVSDRARRNAGGSVPDNFEGAYIYVGPNAPPENLEIAKRFNNTTRSAGFEPTVA